MNILALDTGTKTGWATSINGSIESGVQTFELNRGESRGMRFIRFNAWLKEMIELNNPELIIFEMAHHRGGAATEVGVGLVTRILEACAANNIEHTSVHTGTLKKFATGVGNSSKEDMMKVCRLKLGLDPIDDNEADARWLLEYAIKNF